MSWIRQRGDELLLSGPQRSKPFGSSFDTRRRQTAIYPSEHDRLHHLP